MDPWLPVEPFDRTCVPRASGDGPMTLIQVGGKNECSPRERGWTHDPQ